LSILVDHELRAIGPSILDPYDPGLVQPASIDIRLGSTFGVFVRNRFACIDLADLPDEPLVEMRALGEGGSIVIHPGELILGSTLERITVPSTLARLGLLPHVAAGYFDPGWEGVGTLELANLGPWPIRLRPGRRVCQSRWHRLSAEPRDVYGSAATGSHYQHADTVEGPRTERWDDR
jgi:dCTP deaminase